MGRRRDNIQNPSKPNPGLGADEPPCKNIEKCMESLVKRQNKNSIWFFQDCEGQAVRDHVPHSLRGAVRGQGRRDRHDQEPRRGARRHPRGALQEYLDVRLMMTERPACWLEKSKCCQIPSTMV